tara:strand:+ start:1049 stop:1981 length:933 start_codon:yes stop_codon:yes gene_type:complete
MVKTTKYKNFKIKKTHQNSILLIGNFDGLHLGHQKLFKLANIYKKKYKLKLGVITFDPIPKMFFNKNYVNYRISNFNQKLNYFKKYEVDFIINKKFNIKFSKIKYDDFIKNFLFKKLKVKFIFVSNNFRFGNKRIGNVRLLKKHGYKFNYQIVKPTPLIKNSQIVSSSLIRNLLSEGKLNKANKLLGRNWSIQGRVKEGRKMGRKIGFPTCNIDIKNYVIAKPGVYGVKVKIHNNSQYVKGIANLGYRPTFNQKKILLEVNLFNFNKNLYKRKIEVEFTKYIRGEKKFSGVESLKKQINRDIKIAKKIKI